MKAKLFIGLAVATVAIAAATIFTVNHFSPKSQLSDLNRANIEALTNDETDYSKNRKCYNERTYTGNDLDVAIECGTCGRYHQFKSKGYSGTC
jgi:hypothetical protein